MKMSSCPGYDGIPAEMWKSFNEIEWEVWWPYLIQGAVEITPTF